MKNFRTLLIAQLVAALLLVVILLLAFLQFGKQQLQQQETQAQIMVEQMLSGQIISDGKALSRQLERSLALKSLQISKLDGTILYEQNSAPSQPNLMQRLLTISGKVFQAQTVLDEQQEIRVRFELNPQQQLQALQNHLWLIVFMPLLLGWLPVF